MKAALITIGDEILSGTTLDTNSNFIASELNTIGIEVVQILTVSDTVSEIKSALQSSFERGDLVLTTGGLGPTRDDKTKKAFCEFFDDKLRLDEETFVHLKNLFIQRKKEHLLEINRPQAEIPSQATVFQNFNGTAPALMMQKNNKTAICLPGVPYEVKPLIRQQIIPFLQKNFTHISIVSRTVSVVGIPESQLSLMLEHWENSLPQNLALSYLPVANRVKLKLTAKGKSENGLHQLLDCEIQKLKPLIGGYIISEYSDKIEEILREILVREQLTISCAESCTGGEISKLITSVAGVSEYFMGGIVAYETSRKTKILGVAEEIIQKYTVVSEEVAKEMSLGCQQLFRTDIAVSTTGVAGPDTDEFSSEIGMVFYSVRVKDDEQTFSLFLPHLDRKDFMNYVAMKVLQDLVSILVNSQR